VMKMAAHPDIYGRRKPVIITTDTYRMAATEPLRVFSKIASVPVHEAKNPNDVLTIIKNQRDKDVFLIDTPGRSPFFPNYIQELQSYVGFSAEVKILLALSLTSDLEDMYLSTGLYSVLNPKAIIFTKLDETSRPGKMISMLQQFRLPLAYTCDGQAIPNDIHLPDENDIWNRIIKAVW
jgi:flagellar biosynthesis protein FlhF